MPPRIGRESCKVEFGGMFWDSRVGSEQVDVRWRPASVTRSVDAGIEVRRERSWQRVKIEVDGGREREMTV